MKHIVHVDNSEFFRKLMKTFLSELGRESESFERGEDAIEAVKAGRANIIITGLQLADMSGEELIKRLTVSSQAVPVIVVTSSEDEVQAQRLRALKAKAVLRKSGDWKEELKKLLI
jgi:two-component system cell cycle response regulator